MKLLSKELTDDYIKVLSTHKESALLQGLPDDAIAASKPGELEAVRNDSGIIFVKNRPYILSVMTTFLKDEIEGERAIEELSRAAYEYFSRLAAGSVLGRQIGR